MDCPLRIALADQPSEILIMQRALAQLCYEVVLVAHTGRDLVERAPETRADLLISDVHLVDGDGVAAAEVFYQDQPLPIILTARTHDGEVLKRALAGHALAYLLKPVGRDDLESAIAVAARRFGELQGLREEAVQLRQALEDRKLIERAKGIAMLRLRVDESEAFRRMQRVASNRNMRLIEVAESLLRGNEIFSLLDEVAALSNGVDLCLGTKEHFHAAARAVSAPGRGHRGPRPVNKEVEQTANGSV
jgi:response regulator NasT